MNSDIEKFLELLVGGWLSGNGVAHMNEVTLCQAGVVLGWVTVRGYTVYRLTKPPRPTQPDHPSMGGALSTADGLATAREKTASPAQQ